MALRTQQPDFCGVVFSCIGKLRIHMFVLDDASAAHYASKAASLPHRALNWFGNVATETVAVAHAAL
jgi:hypothetical protein